MSYSATRGQLDGDVRSTLEQWLPSRLVAGDHSDFTISEFSAPDAGYSGKTVFFTASWQDREGGREQMPLVLRMQASDHQLFVEPDAVRQAEVMSRLGVHAGVTTPAIVLTERDPSILGTPFYLMRRVDGRTPSDVPSWHKRGWVADLAPEDRETLFNNALRSLVAVHRVDDPQDLAYLRGDVEDTGTALGRYIEHLRGWHERIRADVVVGADVLSTAIDVLVEQMPATTAEGVVWGDARVGNMSFADDLTVAAIFDWETASTGPPEIDLGWWLMFERYLSESLGFARLPGIPDDAETIRRYEQFGGQPTEDLAYFQLVAACVLSLITNSLATLLIRDGLDVETAHSYPGNAVTLVEQYLGEHRNQRSSSQ